jgi:MULE transposase domain
MLSSNGTTDTIEFFLNCVKEMSPTVWPAVIMLDCDQAQLNALKKVYPDSQILLCIWHVLCAFQSHFVAEQFQNCGPRSSPGLEPRTLMSLIRSGLRLHPINQSPSH